VSVPLPIGVRDVVLLGWPVAHSRSPAMHNAGFAALGLPFVYRALPVRAEDVAASLEALAVAGAVGGNVTVPHKIAVHDRCDRLTDEARLIGAVNTFWWEGEGASEARALVGDNTDALGLERALREDLGLPVDGEAMGGRTALLVGTGGAARAAAVALGRLGATVTVAGRDLGRAGEVARLAQPSAATVVDLAATEELGNTVAAADLVVNATSLGLAGEHLPTELERLRPDQVAYDLVYGPATPFLLAARAAGAAAHGGEGMLLHQAAIAFERWTGVGAPLEVMRAALAGH
jgi:shikimate dehydrogenase